MSQSLPFALHRQHLNVWQFLMGTIRTANGDFVVESDQTVKWVRAADGYVIAP